jgi:hypothetical protein
MRKELAIRFFRIRMAAAGTLLQDLDSTSGGDNDLVQRILSDMNAPSHSGARPAPPPLPQHQSSQDQTMGSGNSHITMDSSVPMSHMIGNQHPSPADFAAAVAGSRTSELAFNAMPVGQMPGSQVAPAPQKGLSWLSSFVLEEVKIPLMASLLFFVFSLPPIRIVISHYIPSIIKQTGEYSMLGLAIVSLILGACFWILQRIVAPLLSL